jgi:hypothetical protein
MTLLMVVPECAFTSAFVEGVNVSTVSQPSEPCVTFAPDKNLPESKVILRPTSKQVSGGSRL